MKNLLLVDDHPIFREAIRTIASRLPEPVNLEEFGSLGDVLARLDGDDESTVILLDLNLPDCSGFEGLSQLRAAHRAIPIVVMSASEGADVADHAAAIGASGYIPKSASVDTIREALTITLAGGHYWPPEMAAAGPVKRSMQLTPTQNRILVGLMQGRLNKQIAFEIGVTEATIKGHLTDIFRKLGVQNRTQAVIAARALMAQEA
jgi:DNA-binding NarL/FixJ family response regulator